MHKDLGHEPNSEAREDVSMEANDHRRLIDDRMTECGFTREELRAIVVEMIG